MRRTTIKWRIFKYNLLVIIVLIALTTIVFNIAIRAYMENDNKRQLDIIASRTEDIALRQGPDFFPERGRLPLPLPQPQNNMQGDNEFFRFYFMLDRSLREPLSVLNADYILLDNEKKVINPLPDEFLRISDQLLNKLTDEIGKSKELTDETYLNFNLSGVEYIAIAKSVADKNSFGLSWIIIYSSLEKVNQLQTGINIILFIILVISSIIISIFSSLAAKKISAPFSALNHHIGIIAERNFGTEINLPVDDELKDLVNNINIMSEKLESHDKAQKTFLQNASHEFRTPLMSIQSYAEGIKYNVVENAAAADIIINETKRMTRLVEDLLYLSRLDTIEENYHFENIDYHTFMNNCIQRMNGIAAKNNIGLSVGILDRKVEIYADEDKLSRAITNIIGNCIRYAQTAVAITPEITSEGNIRIMISDDGPGFECDEISIIFERFYKGRKGNMGLGLAISKSVLEKHNGSISAQNKEAGALFTVELPYVKA